MNRFRISILLMIGGLTSKSAGVVAYHLFRPPGLLTALTTYDPVGYHFAEAVLSLLFDLRGIAPPPAARVVFELLLVFGFGVECFILGIAAHETARLFRKRGAHLRASTARKGFE
jgi:hypothetical protein